MENENNKKRCPKCSKENPDDARFCNVCGTKLPYIKLDVKVCKAAIASFVCALITLGFFIPGLVSAIDPQVLNPKSYMVQNIACISILTGGVAVLLSIIAFGIIISGGGRQTGYGFATIGVVIPLALLFVLIVIGFVPLAGNINYRMVCGTNLSGLGKAILVYSRDYDDTLPSAVGPNGQWVARSPWWAADNRKNAYGLSDLNAADGRASVSASLYLLIKYADATPQWFVCKEDYGITEIKPVDYELNGKRLNDLWDFGPDPPRHCSYSYHLPYGKYALNIECEPGLAVVADRNPWMNSPFRKARDFSAFDPDGNREARNAGNSVTHNTLAQNVLFLDLHVGLQKSSFCGINEDNIYTYWNGEDKRRGTLPKLGSKPADRTDSLLVNDPAIPE